MGVIGHQVRHAPYFALMRRTSTYGGEWISKHTGKPGTVMRGMAEKVDEKWRNT